MPYGKDFFDSYLKVPTCYNNKTRYNHFRGGNMTQNERLDFLINHLISEDNRYCNIVIPKNSEEKFNLFRSLVNVREPKQISNEFIKLQDDYLQERLTEINITDAYDLQAISNKLYLWQGDITTLKCGAIVNAANSAMLGCFVPCHQVY